MKKVVKEWMEPKMEQCNEADVILDQRDILLNSAMKQGRPERLYKIYYKCNEASKTRETLYILITSAMKQTRPERLYMIYYECNEASKTRVASILC